jgi:hypothetical protein
VNLLVADKVYKSQILVTAISTRCPWHDVIEMEFFAIEEFFSTVRTGVSVSTGDSLRLRG